MNVSAIQPWTSFAAPAPAAPPAPPAPTDRLEGSAVHRMWQGARSEAKASMHSGAAAARKSLMPALALAGGLAGIGGTLFYAGSLWNEAPIISVIFTVPAAVIAFRAGSALGKLTGAVVGTVVGGTVGAAAGLLRGAYHGFKGVAPQPPAPPQQNP